MRRYKDAPASIDCRKGAKTIPGVLWWPWAPFCIIHWRTRPGR